MRDVDGSSDDCMCIHAHFTKYVPTDAVWETGSDI